MQSRFGDIETLTEIMVSHDRKGEMIVSLDMSPCSLVENYNNISEEVAL
jgi:hypothetical protein